MRIKTLAILLVLWAGNLWADETSDSRGKNSPIRVAAISFIPEKFDLQGNAKCLESLFRQAKCGGALLAVAPEGALDGYVVNEIVAGEYPAERMHEAAVTLDAPIVVGFKDLARELDMCLVFGLAEQIGEDVFNCAVFIDRDGEIRGKYHKMQLAEGYHPSWWYNRLGQTSRAFDTSLGRCGILICNDRWNPQLARIPALDGAQFLVIPAYGSRSKSQDAAVLSRAIENTLPIIEANVGVSLITDEQRILAVERRDVGIAYADIVIPAARPREPTSRDALEQEFLSWREQEMVQRYERTIQRIGQNK